MAATKPTDPRDEIVRRNLAKFRAEAKLSQAEAGDPSGVPLDVLREYVGRRPSTVATEHNKYLDQVDEIASHFNVPARLIDRRIREIAL